MHKKYTFVLLIQGNFAIVCYCSLALPILTNIYLSALSPELQTHVLTQ